MFLSGQVLEMCWNRLCAILNNICACLSENEPVFRLCIKMYSEWSDPKWPAVMSVVDTLFALGRALGHSRFYINVNGQVFWLSLSCSICVSLYIGHDLFVKLCGYFINIYLFINIRAVAVSLLNIGSWIKHLVKVCEMYTYSTTKMIIVTKNSSSWCLLKVKKKRSYKQ